MAADVLARHHRQRGEDVFFLTGTDEHGTKVAQAAEERGLTPQQHVDQLAPRYRELAAALGASNDFFIRTTDPEHKAFVQGFVERIAGGGDIEKRSTAASTAPPARPSRDERDLPPTACARTTASSRRLEEENYYFLLEQVPGHGCSSLRANPAFVQPKSRYNEALGVHRAGARGHLGSAARAHWGVSVPWDDEQVIYVWVDALINYLSALTYARAGEDLTARYWPAVHSSPRTSSSSTRVIWPALLDERRLSTCPPAS